jgi:hypothetical protein
MLADTNPIPSKPTANHTPTCGQQTCPVCMGVLIPVGGAWRCSRCCFAFCEGCEGGPRFSPQEGPELSS